MSRSVVGAAQPPRLRALNAVLAAFRTLIELKSLVAEHRAAQSERQILAALTHINQLLAQVVASIGREPVGYAPAPVAGEAAPTVWDGVVQGDSGSRSRWRR